jgi:hypothetical protein
MLVSALVLTLDDDPSSPRSESPAASSLLAHLAQDQRLRVGTPAARRLPLVAEVPDAAAGERLVEELQRLPGVSFVDVVLVADEELD